MAALLIERKAEAWEDTDLRDALKVRLGEHHRRYERLQNKLNERIVVFCQKLGLQQDGKPPWVALDGTIDEKARKKFFKKLSRNTRGGFNAEQYRALLIDIDRDIRKLKDLINGAIRLEPIKIERKNKLQSAYWQNVRDQAQRLYDSLSSRFLPCACQHSHQANLRLDIRRDHNAEEDAARFAFLLTFEKRPQPAPSPPWNWRDIEIISSQLGGTFITAPQVSMSGKKKAHFATPVTVSVTSQATPSCSPPPVLAAKIDSLCRVLVAAHQQDHCLGVLEDQDWQHHVFSVAGPASKAQISEAASLENIIRSGGRISPRQKCTLALTLASSVLQLHDTSWLPRAWETSHIFFLKDRGGTVIPSQFYVSRTFTSASQSAPAATRRRLVKNEMVFALGVALLELAHGVSISSFEIPEDLDDNGRADSMTEVSIATRLARDLNNCESENYARAVLRCITFTFDTFAFDFDNREFREAFYQSVVVPLQEDYNYVTGGKA
jgi:hypothetical protein